MPAFAALRSFFGGTNEDASQSKPPYLLSIRSSTFFIVLTVCLAIFTDIFLYGLIVPVIPFSLTVQAGIPSEQVQQWTAILLACYSSALFVGSPFAGLYADHTSSRRWPLLMGLFALAGATVLLCLGKSIAVLILGRILQGLSAAIVWSVGLALLADTMGKNIGAAMGWQSVAMSLGLLISPVVGGAVYAAAGYYAVYYIAFGIIVCDIMLRLAMIEKKVARQWIKDESDGAGAATATSDGSDVEKQAGGLHNRADGARPSPQPVLSGDEHAENEHGEVAPAAAQDAPSASPAPPPTKKVHRHLVLIKSTRLLAALFGVVIEAGAMMAFDTVVPLFTEDTFHWNSTAAGTVFLALFLPGAVSPLVGLLADRYGAKYPSLGGFVVSVPLLACLRFVTQNTLEHKALFVVLLVLLGISLTFSNVPLMAEITYAIEAKGDEYPGVWGEKGVYGIGYGLFTMAFALGGTAGSLAAGYIVDEAGWTTFTWSFGIWVAAGAIVIGVWVGGKPTKPSPGAEQAPDGQARSAPE